MFLGKAIIKIRCEYCKKERGLSPLSSSHFLGFGGLFPLSPPDGLPVVLGAFTGGFVSAIVQVLMLVLTISAVQQFAPLVLFGLRVNHFYKVFGNETLFLC